MRKTYLLLIVLSAFVACKNGNDNNVSKDSTQADSHPAWIMNGNIYEVNVRQYTPEGTFNAFAKHLDRLKDMGVQTLWFMPINPISKVERKGTLGSYYAVSDYTGINPEYGTMADWKELVKQAHAKGFKVLIDWVPNHTGADHYWLEKHPAFYVRDSKGKAVSQFDWTDTRKLNYANAELRDTMIRQMKFWITETGIDGLRCDYAVGPTRAFWKDCTKELKAAKKDVFLLAETDSAWLHGVGFDATYAWPEFNMMKLIAAGKRKASAFDSVIAFTDSTLPKNGLRLFFTNNHDENSWNKADYATMPGASHAPFAVLTQTMKRSVPLIYSGQEEPVLRSIQFFEKDPIVFSKYERAPFYKKLLNLHTENEALNPDASFTRLATKMDDKIYAFAREKNGKKVLVVLNFSRIPQTFTIDNALVNGTASELFSGSKESLSTGNSFSIGAWGYRVYSY
ncbi:MAG: alpha-amylase family glycosyl hydrolase [Sediminibacterium sp.]